MAKFEVGQKVGIRNGVTGIADEMKPGDEFVIEEVRTSSLPYRINGQWWMKESELEPISIVFQPGDIVRAEKGDEIIQTEVCLHPDSPGSPFLQVSYNEDFFDLEGLEDSGYTLTLVKRTEQEIVLPTKNNALITFNSEKYIFNAVNGLWISLGGFVAYEVWEIKLLANVDDYRVIFEGENE